MPEDLYNNQENESADIETEDIGDAVIIRPYDPDKIRVDHQIVNLGAVLDMMEFEEIDLNPDFQREGDLWTTVQKSQLIESVLLGLPLPSFYFSVDKRTGKWVVVDGLQRLSTFKDFWVDKKLKLQGLEFLSSYEGKGFEDLSRADFRKISGFKINQYVIDKDTPPEVKFLIFKRVNTGGLILTPQEMRHALNQGLPADFIKELSKYESFKRATDYRIQSRRQEDRDFVNRFIAFYLLGYDERYEGELDKFLNDGMAELNNLTRIQLDTLKSDFIASMETCFAIFERDCFRKRYDDSDNRKPISKAVYDTLSVNIALLTNEEREILVYSAEDFKYGLKNLFFNDDFNTAISNSTGQKNRVKLRFERVKELIENTIAI